MNLSTFNPWHLGVLVAVVLNIAFVVFAIVSTLRTKKLNEVAKTIWVIALALIPGAVIVWLILRGKVRD